MRHSPAGWISGNRQEQVYQQQQNNQVNENVSEELQTQSKNIAGADVKENTGSGGGYGGRGGTKRY